MSESESEAETLARLEAALLRIAHLSRTPAHSKTSQSGEFDREALISSLDSLISRLRAALNPANGNPHRPE